MYSWLLHINHCKFIKYQRASAQGFPAVCYIVVRLSFNSDFEKISRVGKINIYLN